MGKKLMKNITEENLEKILSRNSLEEVPDSVNEQAEQMLENFIQSKRQTVQKKSREAFYFFRFPKFAFVTVSLLVITLLFFILNPLLKRNTIYITQAYAGVYIEKEGKPKTKLSVNDHIIEKDLISTENQGQFHMHLDDQIWLVQDENSKILFNSLQRKEVSLSLIQGKAGFYFFKDNKQISLKIDTRDFSVYISGTKFIVESHQNDYSQIWIYDGVVQVAVKNQVGKIYSVHKGETFRVQSGKATLESFSIQEDKLLDYINIDIGNQKNTLLKKQYKTELNNQAPVVNPFGTLNFIPIKSPNNIQKNKSLLNFYSYNNNIISFQENQIRLINQNHEVLWMEKLNSNEMISSPFIYQDKIYSSTSNNTILVIDANSGKEIENVSIPGSISYSNSPAIYQNIIYLPLTLGLYTLDHINLTVSDIPIIDCEGVQTPLIYKDLIYINSSVEKTVACYSAIEHSLKWKYHINEKCFAKILLENNSLFIGDISGTIYKFSLQGKLQNKVQMPEKIYSNLTSDGIFLYLLTASGTVYKINQTYFQYEKLLNIKQAKLTNNFSFKSPSIIDHSLIIGNDQGELVFYGLDSKKVYQILKISSFPISTSVIEINNALWVGDGKGSIFYANLINK